MKVFFTFFAIIISFSAFSQNPPPVAMPSEEQIKLIDEFVKVSNYEKSLKKFGMNYLYSKMFKSENGKNVRVLTKKQAENIIDNFDFTAFKEYSIYNAFSFVSQENLILLKEFYKSLEGKIDNSGDLFINNNVIITNFTGYINSEIEKIKITPNK